MLAIVKSLIKKIGLNPDNYGTHSFRSGGTTELFLIGKQAVWIQHFGWWNNIGSVMIYIRPNNPDLAQFVNSTVEYVELRRKEGGLIDEREKQFSELQHEIVKQNKKRVRGNKYSKTIRQVAVMPRLTKHQIDKLGPALKRNYLITQKYNQYKERTYVKGGGMWKFNNKSEPRLAVSPVGDMRTVRTNVNVQLHAQSQIQQYSYNNYNYSYYNDPYFYCRFNNDITGQYFDPNKSCVTNENSWW